MKPILLVGGIVVVIAVVATVLLQRPNPAMPGMSNMTSFSSKTSTSSKQPLGPNDVEMSNLNFSPKMLSVKKGTTVTWHNRDTAHHNVVFDKGVLEGKEGGLIGQGETYQFTFSQTGTFEYHCAPHPYMKANVTVTD